MIVSTRWPSELVALPTLGIRIQLRYVAGDAATFDVQVPPGVPVRLEAVSTAPLPAEFYTAPVMSPVHKGIVGPDYPSWESQRLPARVEHAVRNAVNRIGLAVHLARKQASVGLVDQSIDTLDKALRLVDSFTIPAAGEAPDPPKPELRTALVVEDDANERELLAGLLQMNGCECAMACDGEAALQYLQTAHPDVVLLDLNMPRCDGRETIRRIRSTERLKPLRILTVSGTDPRSIGIAIGPGGVDGWFPKPLNPTQLWDAIRQERAIAG